MAGVFAWAYTGFTNVVVGRRTKALLSQRVNGEQASQRALSGPGDQIYMTMVRVITSGIKYRSSYLYQPQRKSPAPHSFHTIRRPYEVPLIGHEPTRD